MVLRPGQAWCVGTAARELMWLQRRQQAEESRRGRQGSEDKVSPGAIWALVLLLIKMEAIGRFCAE